MKQPPQFTPEQWADILDWYQSGYEAGHARGYAEGYDDAHRVALKQWVATHDDSDPRTPFIRA